jgi:hypothetical protein
MNLCENSMRAGWISSHHRISGRFFLFFCITAGAFVGVGLSQAQVGSGSGMTGTADPHSISGKVVNASTGLPVWRALVRFNDRAMLTGHDGKFEFDQLPDAAGRLQVMKPGFYFSIDPGASSGIALRTGQVANPVELRLYPEAILAGTVVAPDGDPLPHIVVSARRSVFDDNGHRWMPVAQDQTDSHGRFRLAVAPGEYRLQSMYAPRISGTDEAALPTVVPTDTSTTSSSLIRIRSGEEQSFDLHPEISRTYAITATFDSGSTRGFPRIVARSGKGMTIPMAVNISHAGDIGGTRMELPRGTYTLTATVMSPEGTEQAETTVAVTDHDISGLVFHMAHVPMLPVELLVDGATTSDNSQPSLQQFGLILENEDADADFFNSTVRLGVRRDRTAYFTVPPGSYHLRARGNGRWYIKSASYGASDLLQQDLMIGPGVGGAPIRITVSDQTASLQGTCKLGGLPASCWVYLVPTTPSATPVFTLHSDVQGIYNSVHLPPGTYQAIAFEERHSADYSDPATLAPFATYVRTITISAGEKSTLDLATVSAAEIVP